jgi:hypothetical protein
MSSNRFASIEYNITNSSWQLRAKWQFMNRSVTHKIAYGPQLRFGPYNILWVTSRSINCHMALSAMNYLLNIVLVLLIYKHVNK